MHFVHKRIVYTVYKIRRPTNPAPVPYTLATANFDYEKLRCGERVLAPDTRNALWFTYAPGLG